MAQFAVIRPGTIFDFGDERWLNPNDAALFQGNRCPRGLELIQIPAKPGCIALIEARSDVANVDEVVASISSEKQIADATMCNSGGFIADDEKAVALDAFHLDPITGTTRAIGLLAVLRDDTLEAVRACGG
ncbi:hypothetical protein FHT91_004021 [Rhizobium sp. BK347]|nr:hypothetical protein [Rhizobium sp. BK252]MBB3403766.1 hypothetical protein [Rhizobium sp. BK289]MBB3484229.1 hypothetical protein [Rhizobium sp. BK347]